MITEQDVRGAFQVLLEFTRQSQAKAIELQARSPDGDLKAVVLCAVDEAARVLQESLRFALQKVTKRLKELELAGPTVLPSEQRLDAVPENAVRIRFDFTISDGSVTHSSPPIMEADGAATTDVMVAGAALVAYSRHVDGHIRRLLEQTSRAPELTQEYDALVAATHQAFSPANEFSAVVEQPDNQALATVRAAMQEFRRQIEGQ